MFNKFSLSLKTTRWWGCCWFQNEIDEMKSLNLALHIRAHIWTAESIERWINIHGLAPEGSPQRIILYENTFLVSLYRCETRKQFPASSTHRRWYGEMAHTQFSRKMIFRDNRVWSLPIFQSWLLRFSVWHFQLFLLYVRLKFLL